MVDNMKYEEKENIYYEKILIKRKKKKEENIFYLPQTFKITRKIKVKIASK